jgi:hypothetical protein
MLQWILIFYSVPARPVGNRIKLWRRISACGAVPLKGAVYILPHSPENYELCQWLSGEITAGGGECGFAVCQRLENISNDDLVEVFHRHREKDFQALQGRIFELSTRLESIKKGTELSGANGGGGRGGGGKSLATALADIIREFERIRAVDFFTCPRGREVLKQIDVLKIELKRLSAAKSGKSGKSSKSDGPEAAIFKRRAADYAGKTWATRKKPYIDRAASAWLIRGFVDKAAVFVFLDDETLKNPPPGTVAFDAKGAEFTHSGDLCTFEALIKSFGIKDKTVLRIAEVVHDLDIRDDRYKRPETAGVAEIFKGLLAVSSIWADDALLLQKGMDIFEMLYASKSK